MSRLTPLLSTAVLTFAGAALVSGQTTTLPFTFRVQQGAIVSTVGDGASIALAADAIGLASSATVTVTYRGTATASINSVDLTGSLDFQVTGLPDLPFTVTRDQSFSFTVRYLPANSVRQSARVGFNYTEGRTTSSFSLNFSGVAPEFAFSYIPQGGNATPVNPDGIIVFPQTAIDTPSATVVIVTNRGSGPGTVGAITATGSQFALIGLPLPNTPVDAGKDLRFSVAFTPRQLDPVTGSLSIQLPNSRANFALQGSGLGPVYIYEAIQGSTTALIAPNQLLSVPDARLGETSAIVIRFRNAGNAEARIAAIAVQGAGFTLTDLPFLPLTVPVGGVASFTLNFTPAQAGRAAGRLRIGNDTFDVAASGLGAQLNFAYTVGGSSTNLPASGGTVSLPPVPVGRTGTARFVVSNTGTTPTTINSISVSGTGTIFTVSDLPALPAELAPAGTLPFTVNFTPNAVGAATATLRLDNNTFTLSGSGATPAALPDYRFEGAGRTVEPLQQPALTLTLASPYALRVNGTLTLAFNSDVFANDPSVQFATGGRTVTFTIPPNSTRAIFPGNAEQIRLQSGTVAGTITLTPSFATETGIDLTPANAPQLNISVAQAAPRITSAAVSARTANTITLQVTGYATARSVTQIELQFTAASGENLQTTRLSLSVEPSFLAWYQSAASQAFGSQFTATIPLSLQGDVRGTGLTQTDTIQSLAVTAANRQGTSNSVTVSLR